MQQILSLLNSRKTLHFLAVALTIIATCSHDVLGIDLPGIAKLTAGGAVALLPLVTYLFGEGKIDITRVYNAIRQGQRWRCPAFWLSLVSYVVSALTGGVVGAMTAGAGTIGTAGILRRQYNAARSAGSED